MIDIPWLNSIESTNNVVGELGLLDAREESDKVDEGLDKLVCLAGLQPCEHEREYWAFESLKVGSVEVTGMKMRKS